MKKLAGSALVAVLLLLAACTRPVMEQNGGAADVADIYYPCVQDADNLNQVLDYERETVPENTADRLGYLIKKLFETPKNTRLRCAFPQDVSFVSYTLSEGELLIVLGGAYAQLTEMERTIASGCAALTLCETQGVETVCLTAVENGRSVRLGQSLDREDVILTDMSLQPVEQDITLYFPDADCRYLLPEQRKIVIRENEQIERYVAEELLNGPRTESMLQLIPKETKLLSVVTENGICYVNLSGEVKTNFAGTFSEERLILASLANTLTSLDGVDGLQILIDGAKRDYFDQLPIGEPLKMDSGVVGPVDLQSGVEDITVYYPNAGHNAVAAVPEKVVWREDISVEQLALEQLISGNPPVWSYNPIPKGTKLVSFDIDEGVCRVSFSAEFVSQHTPTPERERMAVWAVVATLTRFESVQSVYIQVSGTQQGYQYVSFNQAYVSKDVTRLE